MKKILIMTGIALMAILSCSKDDVKEVNRGKAIDFRAATQTKGEMIFGTWSLGTFYATAVEQDGTDYFRNVRFTQIGEYFSSETEYFWPGDDSYLDFYGFSPSLEELGSNATLDISYEEGEETVKSAKISGVTLNDDILEQVDFVSAITTAKESESTNGIDIRFEHNMAAIIFYANQAQSTLEEYEYKIAGVKISNVASAGSYDLINEEWELGEERKDYTYDILNAPPEKEKAPLTMTDSYQPLFGTYTERDGDTQYHYSFMLPQDFSNASFSVKLQINRINPDGSTTRMFPSDDDYQWVSAEFPASSSTTDENGKLASEEYTWEKGNIYVYYISFTDPSKHLGESVKMSMGFEDWRDGNSNDFANKDMIGVWDAVTYKEVIVKSDVERDENGEIITDENGQRIPIMEDGEYKTTTIIQNELDTSNDPSAISGWIGDFHNVTITDGTKLTISVDGNVISTPYFVENNYMYIDAFKYFNGTEYIYEVTPKIVTLTSVTNGSDGYGLIHILQEESGSLENGTYESRTQVLEYKISPINNN